MRSSMLYGVFFLLLLIILSSLLMNSEWSCTTSKSKYIFPWISSTYTSIPSEFSQLNMKVILLWTPFFSSTKWSNISLQKLNCPITRCEITKDRNRFNYSNLVIFHWRDTKAHDLPSTHPAFQRWALFNLESPHHTPVANIQALRNNINWTITYRTDSDIFVPYGKFVAKNKSELIAVVNTDQKKSLNNTSISKKRLAVWIVSNCKTPSNRENFVTELKRFIPVNVYGSCNYNRCYPINPVMTCFKSLAQQYIFYLAFENSICKDYATEKLYMALKVGLIPVMFSGANYSSFLPPNSYIDALNFSSPKELANYLLTVSKTEKLVENYQEWTKTFEIEIKYFYWFCDVCEKLHRESIENRHYHTFQKLYRWWFLEAKCKMWVNNILKTV
ncbi:alpha-(1,3)-fucosyltransferase C-like [Limulus polyphemus]|uniref:Fucosyltransferase n=1 Tax=Limulus polyphemus TaxID=6850 RepID=A0ABM1B676_LIMPO|nr:alpha-(1,3)-fucosyltransferase C-like [Limulus polyphemus]